MGAKIPQCQRHAVQSLPTLYRNIGVTYLKKGALAPWMVLGVSFCQEFLSHDPTHQAALLSVKMVYSCTITQMGKKRKQGIIAFLRSAVML